MFHWNSKKLLQDTKKVHLLFFVLGLSILSAILLVVKVMQTVRPLKMSGLGSWQSTETSAQVPSLSAYAQTLLGQILFLQKGQLYEYTMPTGSVRKVIGSADTKTPYVFPPFAPVWSPDGKYVAFLTSEHSVVLVAYDTGRSIGSFPLPANVLPASVLLSFDPASELLAIGVRSPDLPPSITFYSIANGKQIGTYPNCDPSGAWVTGVGYVSSCALANLRSINLIRFESESSLMTPLILETSKVRYTIIDPDRNQTVVLLRTTGSTQDLVRLSMQAAVTPIGAKSLPKGVSAADFLSSEKYLRDRIEKAFSLQGKITRVSVSPLNTWLLFEKSDGIYITTVDLTKMPEKIADGGYASIRPHYIPSWSSSIPGNSGSSLDPTSP